MRSTLGVQLPKDGEKEDLTEKVKLLWNGEKDEGPPDKEKRTL